MRILYSFCFYLLLPLIVARLWWKGRRSPGYRARLAERFGLFAPPAPGGIWVHAVSLGETIAALPLIQALKARYPGETITVTTTTPTGSERVRAALGDSVFHVYAPYDLPDSLARFLERVHPRMLIIMETELWPNTLRACRVRGLPVVLANARLSARSAQGYARFPSLTRSMLGDLSAVAAQHADDAGRFVALGLPAERATVTGSIKFDLNVPAALVEQARALRESLGVARPVWIAASTHRGEDELVLQAFAAVRLRFPETLLLLVPRHPERFGEVAALVERSGLKCVRRSEGRPCAPDTAVFLGDSMGELLLFYAAADLAFVGGSLVPIGGHNVLEPAALRVPALTGPHYFNFAEITRSLLTAGGVREVAGAEALGEAVCDWLAEPAARARAGAAAYAVIEANRGALARLLELVERTRV